MKIARRAAAVMVGALALSACSTAHGVGAGLANRHHVPAPAGPSPATGHGTANTGMVVASGHGWTASGLEGPPHTSEHCHVTSTTFRGQVQPLPDPACTPGAIDPAVTQADLGQTICRAGGYTTGVRPPYSITEPAKYEAEAAYGIHHQHYEEYEFDHLVPLELGGASDTRNLWPERNVGGTGGYVRNAKDQVENDLHAAVCAGRVRLAAAQNAIAANWTTAEQVLGVSFGSGGR